MPFFVVIEGTIEIVHPHDGGEDLITVHEPGEFTGEMNMLAGRRSLVRGRAASDGEVLALEPRALRTLVQTRSRAERDHHARVHPAARGPDRARLGRRAS